MLEFQFWYTVIYIHFLCSNERDQNSKGAILVATLEYVKQLRSQQEEMAALKARNEELERQQRQLLLQRQVRTISPELSTSGRLHRLMFVDTFKSESEKTKVVLLVFIDDTDVET